MCASAPFLQTGNNISVIYCDCDASFRQNFWTTCYYYYCEKPAYLQAGAGPHTTHASSETRRAKHKMIPVDIVLSIQDQSVYKAEAKVSSVPSGKLLCTLQAVAPCAVACNSNCIVIGQFC